MRSLGGKRGWDAGRRGDHRHAAAHQIGHHRRQTIATEIARTTLSALKTGGVIRETSVWTLRVRRLSA
jgi:hypothetical protein